MCIIVAKNTGVKMPSMETLWNCFDSNPDGAGFMLADGKAVYGFKGLMTFEEFKGELKRAERRFGSLDKLPVVMHFRISTHGSIVGGNTHPFPLKGGYREMRKIQWKADQGFAHNGIIYKTSYDPDVRKHKVSDTMVFAKKFVNPIARYASIAADPALCDMLYEIACSKLCFLDKRGKITTRGDFIEQDGALYSNGSFKGAAIIPKSSYYDYHCDGKTSAALDELPRIGGFELEEYIDELAEEYGLYPLPADSVIHFRDGSSFSCEKDSRLFFSDGGEVYTFDDEGYEFVLLAYEDEYAELVLPEEG